MRENRGESLDVQRASSAMDSSRHALLRSWCDFPRLTCTMSSCFLHTRIYTHTDTRKFTYIYVYTTRELMLPVNSCANSPLGENSFYSALTVKLISSLVDGHMVHTRFSLLRKRSR